MDRDAPMDNWLRQRMCNLSAKQNSYLSNKSTPLPNHDKRRNSPLSTNRNGPYHGPSTASRTQHHSNHSRLWMLTHSNIPPMFRHHHGPWHHPAVLRLCLLMVWPAHQNDKWSRPQIHLPVWNSTNWKTGHPTEPIYSFPPSNRQTFWKKEPMGRTISKIGNFGRP